MKHTLFLALILSMAGCASAPKDTTKDQLARIEQKQAEQSIKIDSLDQKVENMRQEQSVMHEEMQEIQDGSNVDSLPAAMPEKKVVIPEATPAPKLVLPNGNKEEESTQKLEEKVRKDLSAESQTQIKPISTSPPAEPKSEVMDVMPLPDESK